MQSKKRSFTITHIPSVSLKWHILSFIVEVVVVVIQIGTEFFRGVSGGERKRTNIGMELIIKPQVLFLDEPTTGLDAHTAVSVVKLLKRYSHHITYI